VSVFEVATFVAPKFLSSHILPLPVGEDATGGAFLNTDSLAALWTRNASASTGWLQQAQYLSIDRTGTNYNSLDRAYGFSVRCIQTKFGVPATKAYWTNIISLAVYPNRCSF
jgi:hypothetical protein